MRDSERVNQSCLFFGDSPFIIYLHSRISQHAIHRAGGLHFFMQLIQLFLGPACLHFSLQRNVTDSISFFPWLYFFQVVRTLQLLKSNFIHLQLSILGEKLHNSRLAGCQRPKEIFKGVRNFIGTGVCGRGKLGSLVRSDSNCPEWFELWEIGC